MTDQPASGDAGTPFAVAEPTPEVSIPAAYDVMTAKDPAEGEIELVEAEAETPQGEDHSAEPDAEGTAESDNEDPNGFDEGEGEAGDEQAEEASGEEGGEAEESWIDVDIDGVKTQIPESLKDAFLKNRDYTQKTQKLSEDRKQVEQFAQDLQQRAKVLEQKETQVNQLGEQDIALQTELGQVNAQITAMEQQAAEIEALGRSGDQSAQMEYVKAVQRYEQLKARRESLGRQWNERQTQAKTQRQAEIHRRQSYTWSWASENIEGFGSERWGQMKDLAKGLGINEQALTENIGPAEIQILDLALRGKDFEAAKKNPPKAKPPKKPANFKPGRRLAGQGNPRPTPRLDTSSMDEYLAARNKR